MMPTDRQHTALMPAVLAAAVVAALVLGGCQPTTPITDTPPTITIDKDDLVGRWSAQYANDDGNRVTDTYDLYDDQTFKRATTVTRATAQLVVQQQGDQGEVLSRTVVTGTWDVRPHADGGDEKGTVELQVTGCVGGDCGSAVEVGDTLELNYTATEERTIHLEVAPGTTATRELPPSVNPARDLIGTYRAQIDIVEGGSLETVTLTFTQSRWIWHSTGVDYQQSGGWSISGSTLTKRWYDWDTQSLRSVAKQFRLDGAALVIDPWDWGGPVEGSVDQERYMKVENPLPASMIGSWAAPRYENIDGIPTFTETWRFILRADDTVTLEVVPEPEFVVIPFAGADPNPPQCFHGTLTIDRSELFITFTDTTSNIREHHGATNVKVFDDKTWRNAYAPTDRQDVIVMSTWWGEQLWPGEDLPEEEQIAAVWRDNPRAPYGFYGSAMTREPSTDREPCKL